MQVAFTFRNVESSDTLKEYAKEKLERINKYFPDPIKAHIVFCAAARLSVRRRRPDHAAQRPGRKGDEATEDMHSSIDLVMAKIERQLRRFKDRIRDHKPQQGPARQFMHRVVALEPQPAEIETAKPSPKGTRSPQPEVCSAGDPRAEVRRCSHDGRRGYHADEPATRSVPGL